MRLLVVGVLVVAALANGGPGYAREGTTSPLAMFSGGPVTNPAPPPAEGESVPPPPAPHKTADYPWHQTWRFGESPPADTPLDLGPPLPAWHSEPEPAPPRATMPGPAAAAAAVQPIGPPDPISELPPPPPAPPPPSPPPGYTPPPPERLQTAVGPSAGHGLASSPAAASVSRSPAGLMPGRPRPLRGPAAAVLGWRRGISWRRGGRSLGGGRQLDPRVGGAGGLATEMGRAPGLTPATLTGAT